MHTRSRLWLRGSLLFGPLVVAVLFGLINDSYAQRRGGWGGGYTAPVYRPAPPRPMTPRYVQTPRPMAPRPTLPNAAPTGGKDVPAPRSSVRQMPSTIKPTAPISRVPSYTGRITTKGAPIVVSRTGKTYSVPQQGVFSTRIVTTYQTIKTSLVKKLGSGQLTVLQTRIAKVATGKKVVLVRKGPPTNGSGGGGSGSGNASGSGGAGGDKKGITEAFNKAATTQYKPLGRGSTANSLEGTTLPRNVREESAVKQAMSKPQAGIVVPFQMNDQRWPHSDGWVKMTQTVKSGGEPITVHYVCKEYENPQC